MEKNREAQRRVHIKRDWHAATFLVNAAAIWNGSPALRDAKTLSAASAVGRSITKSAPL